MRNGLLLVLLAPGIVNAPLRGQSPERTAHVLGQHRFANDDLIESSGLVRSRTQAGVLWTLNDSGNPPDLFATDTLGGNLGVVRVAGARNVDWEALSLARCGTGDCLYAADVGNNRHERSPVEIYRIREPRAGKDSVASVDAVLRIRWPDRPPDIEAVFVTARQDVFLITKIKADTPAVFRIPGSAWRQREVLARQLQTLSLPRTEGNQVTDAALSDDERRVAIRGYRYIYFFAFDGARLTFEPGRCDAKGLDVQGEGLAWLRGDTLATTSERRLIAGGTISRIVCRP